MALALAVIGLDGELAALPLSAEVGVTQGTDRHYAVPAADGVNIDGQVMLVRYQNHIFALSLACPHERAAVKWVSGAGRFQCSKHNSRYQPDGTYTSGRSTRNLDRYPVRRDGTSVVVDSSRVWRADNNPAEWAAATISAT